MTFLITHFSFTFFLEVIFTNIYASNKKKQIVIYEKHTVNHSFHAIIYLMVPKRTVFLTVIVTYFTSSR